MMNSSPTSSLLRSDGSALRVYTDIPQVKEFLTRPEFIISMCYILSAFNFNHAFINFSPLLVFEIFNLDTQTC